jgi:hypothetical protein
LSAKAVIIAGNQTIKLAQVLQRNDAIGCLHYVCVRGFDRTLLLLSPTLDARRRLMPALRLCTTLSCAETSDLWFDIGHEDVDNREVRLRVFSFTQRFFVVGGVVLACCVWRQQSMHASVRGAQVPDTSNPKPQATSPEIGTHYAFRVVGLRL